MHASRGRPLEPFIRRVHECRVMLPSKYAVQLRQVSLGAPTPNIPVSDTMRVLWRPDFGCIATDCVSVTR